MKQRRNVGKPLLSLFLAIMLVLQTVMFSTAAYAESAPNDTEVEAVSEPDSPIVDEPSEEAVSEPDSPIVDKPSSVSEEAQDAPNRSQMVAAVPMDKTAVFMGSNSSFPLVVMQGNAVVDPNGIIKGRQPFTLKSEGLKLPVNGDDAYPTDADPEKYIQKGDWIELKREDYFKEVVLPTATKTLNAQTDSGTKQLGTAYFNPNSIRVVFDGEDNFFNGVGRGITFSFETTADADVTGLDYGEKKPVNIFGSTYQLENPDVTAEYGITLTSPGMIRWDQYSYRGIEPAQFVEGAITWQSTVSASDRFDKTIKLPLDGKTFYTNPSAYNSKPGNVKGIYMEGSFKVNNQSVTPVIGADGSLTYIFPSGTGPEPKVEYKTWIPKESYYYEYRNPPSNLGRSHRDMNGKVELRQEDSMLVQAGLEMSFAPDWIQSSASYDHASDIITWKVTVNQYNKNGLKDFTITNVLPDGLNYVSAEWQEDGAESGLSSITPDANGVYSFGDINGKVDLFIKSKVISGSNFKIVPRANWNLDTPAGIQNNDVKAGKWPEAVTDEAIVSIGAHDFTKSGAVSIEDYNQGSITWTVNLAPQYALPNAAVYDVLVHGGNMEVLDNAVDVTGEVSAETIAKIKANVTSAQLWKQYKAGTLKTSADNLTMKSIPLTVDGKVVADLIKVTGYTENSASFSFRALETNPDILFRQDINDGKTSSNRALLIDGDTVRQAEKSANLHLRMLNKDMLFASKPMKADGTFENVNPNNVHSYIRNDNNEAWTISAYDRATKTVTFRLGVNMPGYNTEEMAKDGGNRVISSIKLVDTLPEGWEFVPFSEGKDYELWKGLSDNGAGLDYGTRNDAKTIIEPGTDAHVVSSFTHNGSVGTFTFSKLEGPYVILVKARPSNAALEVYLDEYTTNGTDKQVVYNKADLHMSWGGVEKIVSEKRKIIVPIQTLGKSVTKPVPGVLEWTVNYTPPFNMKQGVYLEDTLGAGMNLRYEVNGKLVLTSPSMAVYPAKLTASGTLEREDTAIDLSDPNAEVQVEAAPGAGRTTVLKFLMKDPNKFYQFVYQTEVDPSTAKAGDKMGNEVKLVGDDSLSAVSARSESTLDSSDVAGSSSSNAILPLRKVDPNGNPLKDVEFTLYKKDDGTTVAQRKTDSEGKLNLLFPDPGYYELKETYIDLSTWLPTTKIYQVYVGNTPGKPLWVDGVKVTSDQPLIVPTPAQGKLTITNKVEGSGSDPNKEFVYTVTFASEGKDGEYVYKKSDNTSGTLKNGDEITLKHGESVVLPALPANLGYTVTENDYTTVEGYTTAPDTRVLSGSIVNKGDHKADFINERIVNKLTISNTVMGSGGDKTKEFEYTIRFEDTGKDESYSYTKSDDSTGKIKSGDTFRLKDGETLDISDLPKNLKYTVSQKDYTTDEYMTTPEGRYYTEVMKGIDEEAPFTNVRVLKGGLLISNTVKGKDEDKSKLFKYTVTFTGEGSDESYVYEKSDGSKGMIKNGDSFELTDSQTLVVQGLPTSLEYKVIQDDYTKDGYVTDPESFIRTGVIPEKKAAEAKFKNTRPYLEGVLRDNNTGEVIPNASITVTDLKTREELQIKTNEKGEYAVPAAADTDYTITYTKLYRVGGKDVPVKFTQKANVNSSVIEEIVPADITAVGIILLKQMDGTTELFNNSYTSHMYIYLKDRDGKYITENGRPKAFPMAPNGTFSVEGLSEQKYTMEVRYQVETGEELLLKVTKLDVKADGELNISEELVDPYGTVYDETTGDASTGRKIEGAKVTLYYADTQRNRDNGRIPGTKVTLPAVPNFPPHDNKSPEQDSDANGFYAYMVFPEADYYLVVTKDGYQTHTSGTISVDFDIVKYDVPMKPIRSGGGSGGNSGGSNGGSSGTDNGTPGTDSGTPGTNNGTPGTNNGTPGTNNGTPGTNNGTPGTNNGTPGTNNGTPGTDNGIPGTDNGIPGTDSGTPGTNTGTSETNNGTPETNTGTPGTNNSNNGTNTGDSGTDNGDHVTDNVSSELDDAPKTGDNSVSPMFYMILALMSLITITFCLLGNKNKKHI
ncbi:SpaA isopeptide-forming pilin-related protein [Paenibacillus sp. AN1007]|uniref:SpaA isopeptide-forming pilin-related protein n=1 Tax=Paenibacillus sp. AN1007 TaxID=3151385 RepID=A0AAU8NAV2_9BACL